MGRTALVATWFIAALAFVVPAFADEERRVDVEPQTDNQGDGEEKSSGGFFGKLFGGDDDEVDLKSRPIDGFSAASFIQQQPSAERPAGRELARREAMGPGAVPVPLPRAKIYADSIVRRLVKAIGISDFEPRVEIISTDEIFAMAYPDGTVLIALGTLRNLESEDEFAAILAHELSHVLLGHHGSDWFLESQQRGLAIYNLVMDLKAQIERQQGEDSQSELVKQYKNRLIGEAVLLGSEIFVDAPFKRVQEDEADLMGTDILIKANYNADAMASMLDKVAAQEAQKAKDAAERAERRRATKVSGFSGLFSSMADAFSELTSGIKDSLREQFGNDHRSPDERVAMVSRYLSTQYPDLPVATSDSGSWNAVVKAVRLKNALDGYRDVLSARRDLADQEPAAAIEKVRSAFQKLDGSEHVLPYTVAAEISAAAGDLHTASEYFNQGLSGYLPSISVYRGLGESLHKTGRAAEAVEITKTGKQKLGDPPQLLPTRILLARIESVKNPGGKLEATTLVARCRAEGLDDLAKQCNRAAKGDFFVLNTNLSLAGKQQARAMMPIIPLERKVRISGKQLNARGGPGTSFPKVASFGPSDTLTVVGEKGKWLQVRGSSGQVVWVAGWLTRDVSPASQAVGSKVHRPAARSGQQQTVAETRKNRTPADPPKAGNSEGDPAVRLRKLKNLHDQGLITDEEYAAKRQKILESL